MNVELHTKRLLLKPLSLEYMESVHAYASDLENTKYMLYLPNESREETAEFLRNVEAEWKKSTPMFYEFAILYRQKQIGSIGISFEDDRKTGEFGRMIDKHYWNRGIVTEAAKAVLSFAVEKLGVTRLIAHCDTENVGSYRVMEKIGMKRTAEYGGRKNKSSEEERREFQYELYC